MLSAQVEKERSEEERLGEAEAQKLLLEEEAKLQVVSSLDSRRWREGDIYIYIIILIPYLN